MRVNKMDNIDCGTSNCFFKKFLNYLSVFSIFCGAFSLYKYEFAEIRLIYFIAVFFLASWLFILKKRIYLNKGFILLFLVFCLTSLYNVLVDNNTLSLFFKQLAGITLNSLFFYLLLKLNDYDVKKLFVIYLNVAFIVAGIGLIQEISYYCNFKPGYDFKQFLPSWKFVVNQQNGLIKINSILPEPADLANVLMPAFFVSIVSFFKNTFKFQSKFKSVIIILVLFLTSSTVAYIGITFCFLLLVFNHLRNRYVRGVVLLVFLLIPFLILNDPQMKLKVTQPVSMLFEKKELNDLNVSSYAFCSNTMVALYSFKKNPVFGSGIGSHEKSYFTYFNSVFTGSKKIPSAKQLNTKDAYSLFLRLLSETGLFGLAVFFIFIFSNYVSRRRDDSGYAWIISNAILSMFLFKLIRFGNYFVDGFFFFLWMYYFTKIKLNAIKPPDEKNINKA